MAEEPEKLVETLEESEDTPRGRESGRPLIGAPKFTPWQRVQIFLAAWVGSFAVSLIGRSLRWQVEGWEHYEAARKMARGFILTLWHREIFAGTWFWRKRGMVVMTSRNFDGEYIARILLKHGYGAARGSSSRGATPALREMVRSMQNGRDAAFTIDGPRGPRFVAKAGSVLLAKATGAPILCCHVVPKRAYTFRKSWDLFQIPYPFSRARVFLAPPINVASDADEEEQARKLREVQSTLEALQKKGEAWLTKG